MFHETLTGKVGTKNIVFFFFFIYFFFFIFFFFETMDEKELEIMSPAGNFKCLHVAMLGGRTSSSGWQPEYTAFGLEQLHAGRSAEDCGNMPGIWSQDPYDSEYRSLRGRSGSYAGGTDAAAATGVNAIIPDMAAITY